MINITDVKDIFKIYDEHDETLKFVSTSGIRIKMMTSLLEKQKNSTQLKDELNVGASTIIHAARDLEKEKLIEEQSDGYHLTSIGKILILKVIDMIKLISVLKQHEEFWLSHNTDKIPRELLERFGELQKLKIVKSSPTNLLQVLSLYMKLISETKELKGVSPFFVPDISKLIKKILKKGGKVRLVISKEILGEVKKSYQTDLDSNTKELVKKGNLRIWIAENVQIGLSVTEKFMSVGLFNINGTYDFSHDLIGYEKEAINWGRDVFKYYKSKAEEVNLE